MYSLEFQFIFQTIVTEEGRWVRNHPLFDMPIAIEVRIWPITVVQIRRSKSNEYFYKQKPQHAWIENKYTRVLLVKCGEMFVFFQILPALIITYSHLDVVFFQWIVVGWPTLFQNFEKFTIRVHFICEEKTKKFQYITFPQRVFQTSNNYEQGLFNRAKSSTLNFLDARSLPITVL